MSMRPYDHPFFRRQGSFPLGSMWDDPWHDSFFDFPTPSRIFGQHFGQGLTEDDLLPPVMWRGMHVRPRVHRQPAQQTGMSQVKNQSTESTELVLKYFFTGGGGG